MFNTTIIKPTREIPTTVHHHEHRAPTDDSIRLAEEYRKKARQEMVAAYRTNDNQLSSSWAVFIEGLTNECVIHGKFSINGVSREIELRIDQSAAREKDWVKKIHEVIARELAAHLTIELVKTDEGSRLLA